MISLPTNELVQHAVSVVAYVDGFPAAVDTASVAQTLEVFSVRSTYIGDCGRQCRMLRNEENCV